LNEKERTLSEPIPFTVDSALLRELGERLVGKPHIALAELVKNSYDADATRVEIRLSSDFIEVSDNGHGMSSDEFRSFWMRIGTPHKQELRISRRLERPLTGSKGVGRLAVQFLSREIEVRTVAENPEEMGLMAIVDWDQAIHVGDLTEVKALSDQIPRNGNFPDNSEHGTTIMLTKLNQEWSSENVAGLAREIWSLQPPFRTNPRISSDRARDFVVDLQSDDPRQVEEFEIRMKAYLSLWDSKLVGKLVKRDIRDPAHPEGHVRLTLEFSDRPGEVKAVEYEIEDCPLYFTEFEIRVYSLAGKQKYGVRVTEARDYFKDFGGIHIYDAGFHLPYYGPDTDWLGIEMAHSHRLSESKLLPKSFQVQRGLNNLPTTSRLFGVVHVDTALERLESSPSAGDRPPVCLEIQVTRDRLVDNKAFAALVKIVRWALDFYAMEQTRRKLIEVETKRSTEPVTNKIEKLENVLDRFEAEIPGPAFMELKTQVREAAEASQTEAEVVAQQIGLLAPLATAGMCALAYEHEVGKQFRSLESVAQRLGRISVSNPALRHDLDSIRTSIEAWITRAKGTRALFSHLTSAEHNEKRQRFKARVLLELVKDQLKVLIRDLPVDTKGVQPEIWLPEGTFSEWSALFQNILVNATNALLDSERKLVAVRSIKSGMDRKIRIEDTGAGVVLESAEELFEPFVRRLEISSQRRALGLGGSGLGLTIVQMIADNVGCRVGFVEPSQGFSTCFELSWKERK
jgi:signal transduction histidine kinase